MEDFQTIFTVKREVTQAQFMRALLVKLALYHDSPFDVCTAEFGKVKESEKEVLVCRGHVETNYSASIGYDRKEEYWDKEKKYQNGREYYVDVKKVRTVTDWSPFSGHTAGEATCAAFNGAGGQSIVDDDFRIFGVLSSIKAESLQEKGEAVISYEGLNNAKQCCALNVEAEIEYPGDHVKNKSVASTVDVLELDCYILPYYEVEFTYKDKKYLASGFACGNIGIETEYPPNNVDIKKTVNQEVKPWKLAAIGSWVALAAVFIAAIALNAQGITWFWAFVPVLLVVAIVVLVVGNKKYNTCLHALQEENLSVKLKDLSDALQAYGYDQLTDKELKDFKI